MDIKIINRIFLLLITSTVLSYLLIFLIRFIIDRIGFGIVNDFLDFFSINFPSSFSLIGFIFLIPGFYLIIMANYTLLYVYKFEPKNREPYGKPNVLVTTGPYSFTRNPIYLGVLILIIGFFLLIHNFLVLILWMAVYLLFRYKFISWEERYLYDTFGLEYTEYCEKTPRWI